MDKQILLSAELVGNKKDARCVAILPSNDSIMVVSGSPNGQVLIWTVKLSESTISNNFKISYVNQLTAHNNSGVYSVAFNNSGDSFFSADASGLILESSLQAIPIRRFMGHRSAVNSLSVGSSVLVSGSWDATARVWSIQNQNTSAVLSGHKHAVAVCLVREEDELILTGSQDGILRFFQKENLLDSVNAHSDIIRKIRVLKIEHNEQIINIAIVCSNDGAVSFFIVGQKSLQPLKIESLGDNKINLHNSFIFDVASFNFNNQIIIATASDDHLIKIVKLQVIFQGSSSTPSLSIISSDDLWLHPNSVWAVEFAVLPSDPFTLILCSGCADGIVRIFSTDSKIPLDLLAAKVEEARLASAPPPNANDAIDIHKLPKAIDRAAFPGRLAGQSKLFVEIDPNTGVQIVSVYSWTGTEWIKVGDYAGAPSSDHSGGITTNNYFDGDDFFPAGIYDHIFNVEIANRPGVLKLPYRIGQNPMQVAETFCARERMGKLELPDIVRFIETNALGRSVQKQTSQTSTPPTNMPSTPLPSQSGGGERLPPVFSDGPTIKTFSFGGDAKWSFAVGKLRELNELQEESLRLSTAQWFILDSLATQLTEKKNDQFKMTDLQFLFGGVMLKWSPVSDLFPLFDFWRKVTTVPDVARFWKMPNTFLNVLNYCGSVLESTADNVVSSYLISRFLTNLIVLDVARPLLIRYIPLFEKTFKNMKCPNADDPFWGTSHAKVLTTSLSSCLFNFSAAAQFERKISLIAHCGTNVLEALKQQNIKVLETIFTFIEKWTWDMLPQPSASDASLHLMGSISLCFTNSATNPPVSETLRQVVDGLKSRGVDDSVGKMKQLSDFIFMSN